MLHRPSEAAPRRRCHRQLRRACAVLLLTALLLPGMAPAADALRGDLRFVAQHDGPVWVGEQLNLYLELWTDGFSFGDQQFVLPDVPGGYLLQGDSNTVKLSEDRDGVAWQGLRYTLMLFPQLAGRLEIPPFDVRFTARAGFGSEPAPFQFRTQALRVEARLPAGAEPSALLVTTTAFTLEARWDRGLPAEGALQLQVGDALTLEVTRRADDVPAMVFAPLPTPAIDGLGAYPGTVRVNDRVNRGELTGERTDRVTFICETDGTFLIPEWRFQWWDPNAQRLADKVISELRLDVRANPAYAGSGLKSPATEEEEKYGQWFLVLLLVLILGAAWRRLAGLVRQRLRGRRSRNLAQAERPQQRSGRLLPLNPRGGKR